MTKLCTWVGLYLAICVGASECSRKNAKTGTTVCDFGECETELLREFALQLIELRNQMQIAQELQRNEGLKQAYRNKQNDYRQQDLYNSNKYDSDVIGVVKAARVAFPVEKLTPKQRNELATSLAQLVILQKKIDKLKEQKFVQDMRNYLLDMEYSEYGEEDDFPFDNDPRPLQDDYKMQNFLLSILEEQNARHDKETHQISKPKLTSTDKVMLKFLHDWMLSLKNHSQDYDRESLQIKPDIATTASLAIVPSAPTPSVAQELVEISNTGAPFNDKPLALQKMESTNRLTKLAGIPPSIDDAVEPMPNIQGKNAPPLQDLQIQQAKSQEGVVLASNFASHKHMAKEYRGLYIALVVVIGLLLLAIVVALLYAVVQRIRKKYFKKSIMGNDNSTMSDEDYRELCRQRYATKNAEKEFQPDQNDAINGRDSFLVKQFQTQKSALQNSTPSSAVSTPVPPYMHDNLTRHSSIASLSWSEEPITATLDISTGHAILSYMEDHLKNQEKLDEEWAGICAYEADDVTVNAAMLPSNVRKNRSPDALPFDQNRVILDTNTNHMGSDYINASLIIDNDPKNPLYIAAQGPLSSTIPDFWQTVWEKGCAAIVMLAPLVEESVPQSARYWPDEGSCSYDRYEIHLVSEHIWCEDYLVRSLYLKNTSKGETRTVTQFHFLSWPNNGIPQNTKALLELRRKVTKCYKGQSSPVLVHCNDGAGRTGTYILLDLAINRMLKGAKEIDIAATLEHIRDQRQGVVRSKEQFEFALTAVADEVNAILKSLTLTQ